MSEIATKTTGLQQIDLERLHPHPDNPRLAVREDVVAAIASNLKEAGRFGEEHAILCRPDGDGYQIVSGHQRVEAAKQAGLTTVAAWVREMSDEEARMQLLLANAQSELDPLEVGIHAYRSVPKAQGRQGSGLQAYADAIGRTRQDVSTLRKAGEVFLSSDLAEYSAKCRGKAFHLAALHKADRRAWPVLARAVIDRGWTVEETKGWVEKVVGVDIPSQWEKLFLPYRDVVAHMVGGAEFSPASVKRLSACAELALETLDGLRAASGDEAVDRAKDALLDWLRQNTGGAAWDHRKVELKAQELQAELRRPDSAWNLGDWRDHVSELEHGSVALLLVDPPYGLDMQPGIRKSEPTRRITNDGPEEALVEYREMLEAIAPKLAPNAHVLCFTKFPVEYDFYEALRSAGLKGRGSLVWVKNNHGVACPDRNFAPKHERILHAVRGDAILYERHPDVLEAPRVPTDLHPTQKPVELLERLIKATTAPGQLVADPMGGVASTLVAAKRLGRAYWGCEIDEEYHAEGEKRLRGTEAGGVDDERSDTGEDDGCDKT